MQRYRLVILMVLFGVLPVIGIFFLAASFPAGGPTPPAEAAPAPATVEKAAPDTVAIFAAARVLPVGTLLAEEDLTTIEVERPAVRPAHFVVGDPGAEALRGHAVREALEAGDAFTQSSVVGPRQSGFLSAVLRPGARAVTIRVGAATSHAGLIDPGDRVDVILSAELASGPDVGALARTIVEDVRVVAVDRRIGSGAASLEDGEAPRHEIVTATLEVSPTQGDRLVLGEHEGKLSLAVRPLAGAAEPPLRAAVNLGNLLLPPQTAVPVAAPTKTVRILRGAGDFEEVSFQR